MPYYDKNAILKALTKEQVIKIVTDLDQKDIEQTHLGILSFKQSVMVAIVISFITIMNLQISILEEHFIATPHVANHSLFLN